MEKLTKKEAKLIASILQSDSIYLKANKHWFNQEFLENFIELKESSTEREFNKLAQKYSEKPIKTPEFSKPSDIWENTDNLEKLDFLDKAIISSIVKSTDWIEYLCSQTSLEIDKDLLRDTRKNSVLLVKNKTDNINPETKEFCLKVLKADIKWLNHLENTFEFTAPLAEYISLEVRKAIQELENQ